MLIAVNKFESGIKLKPEVVNILRNVFFYFQ